MNIVPNSVVHDLVKAAYENEPKIVGAILNKEPHLVHLFDHYNGHNALTAAAEGNAAHVVKELLHTHGVELTSRKASSAMDALGQGRGLTAAHLAVGDKEPHALRAMVEYAKGGEPKIAQQKLKLLLHTTDNYGHTVLDYARQIGVRRPEEAAKSIEILKDAQAHLDKLQASKASTWVDRTSARQGNVIE